MSNEQQLLPCPFCGGGETEIRENGKVWSGMSYSSPSSVSVLHHCDKVEGQPSRSIERVGRDLESAIEMWNTRATQSQPSPVVPVSDEWMNKIGFLATGIRSAPSDDAAQELIDQIRSTLLALKPEQVLQCGHHISLAINSSESGEFLYCDLCDARSQRNDAQQMERELSEELAAHSAMFGETNPAPVAQVHDKKPRGWLCELAQEDGTIRTQFVEEDPSLTLWNDIGEPTPVHVTPLFD